MNKIRKFVRVEGIVQGVGFRPFVYKIALENNIRGWVNNTPKGVYIDIEGYKQEIYKFLKDLKEQSPPLSKIERIYIENKQIKNYNSFTIEKSRENNGGITFISPDISICEDCKREINDENNFRYQYPFTNCTNCGPRFSIIKELPYDRHMTTMKPFEMCKKCSGEYKDPEDRRFHAQPNACPKCGPEIFLLDNKENKVKCDDSIKYAVDLIKDGNILALKGLGGFHLVCDAKNEDAVNNLRKRKLRPHKPFAVMMKDIKTVKKYCYVSKIEEEILTGIRKPILLLNKKESNLFHNIAPNNDKLGVMLPYTPIHELLFNEGIEVLIMTSGNVSGLPIEYENDSALNNLKEIIDYFLIHNRDIHIPIDDSVSRVILGEERLIRRARGYAPTPIKLEGIKETLAFGSHLKNTFSISKENYIFLSQHIGDLENTETYEHFEKGVNHFKKIYNITPKIQAYDMHPNYLVSKFIKKENVKKVFVQHHHAHIVSCMVENNVNEKVIGIAFDGTGFGDDGKIWGGEFLICDYKNFERTGHINYVKMPGGDLAVKEPWRMAVSYLFNLYKDDINSYKLKDVTSKQIQNIIKMIKGNINCPQTSSMGRLFDAVSALLGIRNKITYEGQAAIELEAIADVEDEKIYDYEIENSNEDYIISTKNIMKNILEDIEENVDIKIIAKRFHNTVIDFSVSMCKLLREKYTISSAALSGGVFQNEIILTGLYNKLLKENFNVYIHKDIPCNDGGISLGQIVIANHKEKEI